MEFKVLIVLLVSFNSINCLKFTTTSNVEVNVYSSATAPYLDILKGKTRLNSLKKKKN